MIVTKPIILQKLQAEMITGGLSIRGLVLVIDAEGHTNVLDSNAFGQWVDLPPEASAIIDAHDGTPPDSPDYGSDVPVDYALVIANVVSQLRAYYAAASPTPEQSVIAIKLLIPAVLYQLQRQFP